MDDYKSLFFIDFIKLDIRGLKINARCAQGQANETDGGGRFSCKATFTAGSRAAMGRHP